MIKSKKIISLSLPPIMNDEIEVLVKSGDYSSKSDVMRDAFRVFLEHTPGKKIQVATEMYHHNKVSLSRASEIAGMDIESFKEILVDRGVKITTATPSREELEAEMQYIE